MQSYVLSIIDSVSGRLVRPMYSGCLRHVRIAVMHVIIVELCWVFAGAAFDRWVIGRFRLSLQWLEPLVCITAASALR